jgi:pyruvate/2-oxoglutarate dehydrogenase complex dihydrolipoamide acyltransferase (E2) component
MYVRVNRGEVIAIAETYKVLVDVYFVSEGQITQPRTVVVGQVVTERNGPLFSEGKGKVVPVLN